MSILSTITEGKYIDSLCDGRGSPAQLLLNGTVFLICDPSAPFAVSKELEIALGVGLGLGFPAFLGLVYLIVRWGRRRERPSIYV